MFPLSHFPLYFLLLLGALEPLSSCRSIWSAGLKSVWLLRCHLIVPLEPWWQIATFSVLRRPLCLLPVTCRSTGRSSSVGCRAAPSAPLSPAKAGGGSTRKGCPTNQLRCGGCMVGLDVRPLRSREQLLQLHRHTVRISSSLSWVLSLHPCHIHLRVADRVVCLYVFGFWEGFFKWKQNNLVLLLLRIRVLGTFYVHIAWLTQEFQS